MTTKRLITAVASLALAGAILAPATGQAASINECGTYNPYGHHWTSTKHPDFSGYTPVYNLTTRDARCSYARPFARHVSNWAAPRHYHGFTCTEVRFNGEGLGHPVY